MIQRRTQSGITLMEMIVAIGVVSVLLVLVNTLFFATTDAMSRGIQTGDVIGAQRAVSDQIERDFSGDIEGGSGGMRGPHSTTPGFLVIINNYINDNPPSLGVYDYNASDIYDLDAKDGIDMPVATERTSVLAREMVRSDQVAFMSAIPTTGAAVRPVPLTPRDEEGFGPYIPLAGAEPQFYRVWYGHVLRTDSDGTDPDGTDPNRTILGNPNSNDTVGHNLILGRQALFFYDAPDPGVTYQDGPEYFANVVGGYASDIPGSIQARAYMGFTDRVVMRVWDLTDPNSLMGPVSNYLQDGLNRPNYANVAFDLVYVRERLRANPAPDIALTEGLESWQVAQTHPVFAPNVSDFIVEFAADANNDGEIDIDTDGDGRPDTLGTNGDIVWYGHGNLPDTAPFDFGAYNNAYRPMFNFSLPLGLPGPNAQVAFIWRHNNANDNPGAGNNCSWPYMLRIRYRLHDRRGRLYTSDATRLYDGINNNEDHELLSAGEPTPPGALRIDDDEESAIAGQWFEVIVPVNRP